MSGNVVDNAARGYADPQWASDNVHRTMPYTVGLANESGSVLGRFSTEEAASEFIATLEGYEDGRYYLDGPPN